MPRGSTAPANHTPVPFNGVLFLRFLNLTEAQRAPPPAAPPGDARAACRGTSVQSLQRPTGARADACSCADGGIIARPAAAVSNEHQLNSAAAGARSHAGHVVHHGRRCCRFGAPSPLASPAKTGRRSPQAWHFLLQAAPRRHLASC
jgi:hypothetical protein